MPDHPKDAIEDHLAAVRSIEAMLPGVAAAARSIVGAYEADGQVLAFGNGGSAADAQHLAAELVGRYRRDRRALAAMSLSADPSVLTCIGNDFSFEDVFARQVRAFARPGDVAVGFTTSGRSKNVVRGLATARELGATTVVLTGGDGTPASTHADHAFVVPSQSTARIQEVHVLLLHLIVEQVDAWASG